MKILRTNNYKIRNINKCPKCNSKLFIDYNLDISFFMSKKIKNFAWKKFFIKNDKDTGSYFYDYKDEYQPIVRSVCGNYHDLNKNPQGHKTRVAKIFKEKRESVKLTCNHIYCNNCVYSLFIENMSYLDILKEKI